MNNYFIDKNAFIFQETKDRQKLYEALKEKDTKEQNTINYQIQRNIDLHDAIKRMKMKIAELQNSSSATIDKIMEELNFFVGGYWIIKNRYLNGKSKSADYFFNLIITKSDFLILEIEKDKSQLVTLTVGYNTTTDTAKKLISKLEKMLTWSELCKKLETEEEKAKVYYTSSDCSFGDELIRPEVCTDDEWILCQKVSTKHYYFC